MIKAGITNTDFSVTAQDPRKEEALASYPLECVVIVGVPARVSSTHAQLMTATTWVMAAPRNVVMVMAKAEIQEVGSMDLISYPANQHCYNPSDDGVVRLWTLRHVIPVYCAPSCAG